jgi:heme oxygenase
MTQLSEVTCELRHRIDAELDLFGNRCSWLDYRLFLFRMYGFHVPIESALVASDLDHVILDANLRNKKAALISYDLRSLGVDRRDLVQLPCMLVPAFDELPEALGWMYVLEASTLWGKQLAVHLATRLPLEIESAAAYLSCYGSEVEARWAAFGAALDGYAEREQVSERINQSAIDCLVRLARWFRAPCHR